jgi:hypothetical protein
VRFPVDGFGVMDDKEERHELLACRSYNLYRVQEQDAGPTTKK